MFDFVKPDPRRPLAPAVTPLSVPRRVAASHRSLLYWCEHCVECAAPACYRTCDLFESRDDGHCRRFRYGIVPHPGFPGTNGSGAEITFKKWAKLETQGNVRMGPDRLIRRAERWMAPVGRFINGLGRLIWKATGNPRWSRPWQAVLARLARRFGAAGGRRPDGFLLEVYNPDIDDTPLQLIMRLDPHTRRRGDPLLPPFEASLRLPPGFSRHFLEASRFEHITASGRPFLVSLTPAAETTPTLLFLGADFVVAPELAAPAKPIKVMVWDLDGTLWDGILIESSGVRLRPGMAELLEAFDRRGVLHSIASKNDYPTAWEQLEKFGISRYFVDPRIGWNPKSESVRDVARRLNLGLDSFAFIDDSAFERAEVNAAAPEVTCIDPLEAAGLLHHPRFQGSNTEEAKARRSYYQAALVRERDQAEAAGDYLGFLAACDIRLEVDEYQPADFDRVAELLQRTNQLNFSGRHYSREDVRRIARDPACSKLVLRCRDRYGAYGTVGFAILRPGEDEVAVEDFMLSCRVQAKYIEQAFFSHLRLQNERPVRLFVNYRDTGRNKPAGLVLESMRFEPCEGGGMNLEPDRELPCEVVHVAWMAATPAAS